MNDILTSRQDRFGWTAFGMLLIVALLTSCL